MKREKFIQSLATHVPPVKRIYPVWITFLLWILFSFLTTLLFVWNRSGNFVFLHIPKYLYELSFIFFVFASSAFIAIYTSIPGNRIRDKYLLVPILFLLTWVISILLRFFINNPSSTSSDFSYHNCTKDILLMSLPPATVLIYIINRRLPMRKNWIGFWIITASASISALGVAFLCANEFPKHLLFAHTIPVILVGLFGIFLGRLIFKEKF